MQSFSILMGIIIGAVAILIGSITGLYGLLLNIFHNKVEKGTSSEVGKIEAESTEINSLNKSVNCQNNDNEVSRYLNDIVLEIKDNVLWLIKLYALNIILIYGYSIHFSFNLLQLSIYSNYYPFFSMKSIITSLNIFVLFISLYIVFDIVSAIFTIYQTHMLAISEEFKIKN